LGGPNFHEIPINRSLNTVHNNQRDGHMRQQINKDRTSYNPNSLGGGCPYQAKAAEGGFTSYAERIDAKKVRARSQSFFDHFSQARLFYNSQSEAEKNHLTDALRFELSKVETIDIRVRMLGLLSQVDKTLAQNVADELGLAVPKKLEQPVNHSIPADGNPSKFQPRFVDQGIERSAALSMANTPKDSIKSRKIAMLAANGVNGAAVKQMIAALLGEGAVVEIIAPKLGDIVTDKNASIKVDKNFLTVSSVLYDAVYVPGGKESIDALANEADAIYFINQAYKHCKAIAVDTDAETLIAKTSIGALLGETKSLPGFVFATKQKNDLTASFIKAIAQHRFWERETMAKMPA
jgi:catalase